MKVFRAISSLILCLILSFNIVFLQGVIFTNCKLLNPEFYLTKFENFGFYDFLYDSTYKSFSLVSRKSNLPQELFDGVVTKEWIKEHTETSTKETLDYILYKADKISALDTTTQSQKFSDNVDKYIDDLNLKLDKNVEKEIGDIKTQVSTIIKSQSAFVDMNALVKRAEFQRVRKIIYLIYSSKLLLIVAMVINVLLLLLMVKRGLSNYAAWIGYALVAGGFFTFVPSLYGMLSGFMNNLSISETSLKQMAIAFIKDFLSYFITTGGISLALGIIIISIVAIIQKKENKEVVF